MTPCWEWSGSRRKDGYGRVHLNGRRVYAHRRSWELFFGPIPKDMVVCHRCDNPPCVNPEHLFLGTHADNARDCISKRRNSPPPKMQPEWFARGERNGKSKLDIAAVVDVYQRAKSGEALSKIAASHGVCHGTVHAIATGRSWSHVTAQIVVPMFGGGT